jgi:uncharacterized repeat protein (TIGR04076 family)
VSGLCGTFKRAAPKEKIMEKEIEEKGLANSQEKYRCRITVLKKTFNEDLYRQFPCGGAHECGILEAGQTFVTENRWSPPDGLCTWAWSEMRPVIQAIHGGSEVVKIACCTDGLRPVFFKLERVDTQDA